MIFATAAYAFRILVVVVGSQVVLWHAVLTARTVCAVHAVIDAAHARVIVAV